MIVKMNIYLVFALCQAYFKQSRGEDIVKIPHSKGKTKRWNKLPESTEPVNGVGKWQTSFNPGYLTLSKHLGDAIHPWPQVSPYIFAEYAILQASPSSDREPFL